LIFILKLYYSILIYIFIFIKLDTIPLSIFKKELIRREE